MNKIRWRLHGTAAASIGLISAVFVACGGDDSTTTVPTVDAGNADSAAQDSSKSDSSSSSTSSMTDAETMDQSVTDAPADKDSGNKDAGDATTPDADAAPAPLPPLDLCSVLDNDFGGDISNNDMNAPPVSYGDRAVTWGAMLMLNGTLPSYALSLTNDCRINNIETIFTAGSGPNSVTAYLQQLDTFLIQFMGCGLPDAGALSFASVIPAPAVSSGHVFTQADIAVIIELFVNSIDEQAAIAWYNTTVVYPNYVGTSVNAGFVPPAEPLTADQLDSIRAHIQALAAAYPGVNPNPTKLTFSSCGESDGGTDGGRDGGADAGDAGHD